MKLFSNDREALLVERPNRFLIKAELVDADGTATGEIVSCHCPNPGRMLEFLVPGTRLILEDRLLASNGSTPQTRGGLPAPDAGVSGKPNPASGAKTRWTAAALYHRDAVVPIYAARANAAARELVIPQIIPDIAELRAEYAIGSSRFDFLAIDSFGTKHLIEVKSCSLVEAGAAMFPDAPSERAVKHLEELAALKAEGYISHVVFVIAHGYPSFFAPNAHTDPRFAKTLAALAPSLSLHAALIRSGSDGDTRFVRSDIPINLSSGSLAEADSGCFLAVFETAEDSYAKKSADNELCDGSAGTTGFAAESGSGISHLRAWYVLVGFEPERLSARLAGFSRKLSMKAKTPAASTTPADALAARAVKTTTLPVLTVHDRSDELASALVSIGGMPALIPHRPPEPGLPEPLLYRYDKPPLKTRAFLDLLFRFRAESLGL